MVEIPPPLASVAGREREGDWEGLTECCGPRPCAPRVGWLCILGRLRVLLWDLASISTLIEPVPCPLSRATHQSVPESIPSRCKSKREIQQHRSNQTAVSVSKSDPPASLFPKSSFCQNFQNPRNPHLIFPPSQQIKTRSLHQKLGSSTKKRKIHLSMTREQQGGNTGPRGGNTSPP